MFVMQIKMTKSNIICIRIKDKNNDFQWKRNSFKKYKNI